MRSAAVGGRTFALVGMTALLLPTLVSLGAPPPPAVPATGATCPGTLTETNLTSPFAASSPYECKVVHVRSNATVPSGQHLIVRTSRILFHPDTTLRVAAGGSLSIDDTIMSSMDPAASSAAFRLVADAGSTANLSRVVLDGARELQSGSNALRGEDIIIRNAHGWAILLVGGNAALDRLRVELSTGGLALRNGAVAQARDVTLSHVSAAGLDVHAGTLDVDRLRYDAVHTPVLAAGPSMVRIANVTFDPIVLPNGSSVPRLPNAFLGLGGPRVWAYDVTPEWPTDRVDFADNGSHFTLGGLPVVRVVDGDGVPVGGVRVEARPTASAPPTGIGLTGLDGRSAAIPVTRWNATKQGVTSVPSSLLVATKLHNVATQTLDLTTLPTGHIEPMVLPEEPDFTAPAWGTSVPPLSAPAWNATGVANLTWLPAVDPGGAGHAVSHYLLHTYVPQASTPTATVEVFGIQRLETLAGANETSFRVQPVDLAGNIGEPSNAVTVRVDAGAPMILANRSGLAGPHPEWFRGDAATVRIEAIDNASGIHSLHERTGSSTGCGGSSASNTTERTISTLGLTTLQFRACDRAGNHVDADIRIGLDRTPPETLTHRLEPPRPDGRQGWYSRPVDVVVDAEDATSGIHRYEYQVEEGGPWTAFNGTAQLNVTGDHLVIVNVTDRAGNFRLAQVPMKVDVHAPTLTANITGTLGDNGWYRSAVEIEIQATDQGSGIDERGFRTPTSPRTPVGGPLVFNRERNGDVRFYASDVAGNVGETPWQALRIDLEPPVPPTVTLGFPTLDRETHLLDWSLAPPVDATSDVASIEIHRSLDEGGPQRLATLPPTATSYAPALVAGKTNRFVVRAVDHAGWSADSNAVQLTPTESMGRLLAVADDARIVIKDAYRFQATPTDPENTTSVSFYVDGVLVHSTAFAPWEYEVLARELSNGQHTLRTVVAHQDGSQHEEAVEFEIRTGYARFLEDRAPYLIAISALALVGQAVAAWGLRKIRLERSLP